MLKTSPAIDEFWIFFFFSVTELVHIRLDPNWHLIYVCSEVPYEQNMDAVESTGGENT